MTSVELLSNPYTPGKCPGFRGRGVGKGGAGGAVAPPLFEKGGHSPPTFWAVICINCLYLLSSEVKSLAIYLVAG